LLLYNHLVLEFIYKLKNNYNLTSNTIKIEY